MKTLSKALNIVIKESNDEYAKTYARACLDLGGATEGDVTGDGYGVEIKEKPTGKMMVGRELKIQLLYVLNNLQSWRGEIARETKKTLKVYAKN